MAIDATERLDDIEAIFSALTASGEAFESYHKLYCSYRCAVKAGRGVATLFRINEDFTNAKYACRKAFDKALSTLDEIGSKYTEDAMHEVFQMVTANIATWNHDAVRSKYAALWMYEFGKKFAQLKKLGERLNEIAAVEAQIAEIAAESFPSDLVSAN